jgi:hypothetical protein
METRQAAEPFPTNVATGPGQVLLLTIGQIIPQALMVSLVMVVRIRVPLRGSVWDRTPFGHPRDPLTKMSGPREENVVTWRYPVSNMGLWRNR